MGSSTIYRMKKSFQLKWDEAELTTAIEKISKKEEPHLYYELTVHFLFDGADIFEGCGWNDATYLFGNLYWMFKVIDPDHLGNYNCFYDGWSNNPNPDDLIVHVGTFSIKWNYDNETDLLMIYYNDPRGKKCIVVLPLKEFVHEIIVASNKYLVQVRRIWPKVIREDEYLWIKEGMETIKKWYEEKYGELFIYINV